MNNSQIVYEHGNGLYLNITNRCPTVCCFCIKSKWNMRYRGYNLRLEKEPSLDEVIRDVDLAFQRKDFVAIVFCGYGEPMMRWELIRVFSSLVREKGIRGVDCNKRIRINTNGLGNLINKRDITVEMKGLIDAVCVSLNTLDPKKWFEIMRPLKGYENGFESVIDFILKAKENVKEVVVTVVDLEEVDVEGVEEFAKKVGVKFRKRAFLENEEV